MPVENTQVATTEYRFRPARLEEAGQIQAVARETWEATYAEIIRPEVRASFIQGGYSPAALGDSISREGQNSWFWVVEAVSPGANSEIIGFAQVYLRPTIAPDAELTRIYLRPAWQHKGIGKALLDTMIRELRALRPGLRPPRLWLSVAAENYPAIRFYERRGFRPEKAFVSDLFGQRVPMQEYVLEI